MINHRLNYEITLLRFWEHSQLLIKSINQKHLFTAHQRRKMKANKQQTV